MKDFYDYLIIGGGVAGLATSSILKAKGQESLLLESHTLLGGSASHFRRHKYVFDVGATTLSGIKNKGPLGQLMNELGIDSDRDLKLKKITPGIISILNNKKIFHYDQKDKIINEYASHFPHISKDSLTHFINTNFKIESLAAKAIINNSLPKRKWPELFQFFSPHNLEFLPLLPLLSKTYEEYLQQFSFSDTEFQKMIDELLFITTQNNSQETPALFGILGAQYPTDAYYAFGGMKNLIDQLASKSSEIKLNQKVLSIKKDSHLFTVKTKDKIYYAKNIISTLPEENNLKLASMQTSIGPVIPPSQTEAWSAFTLYFTIPHTERINSLYYQIHFDDLKIFNTQSYFVSFSHPEDHERNFNQRMTVTISTHAKPSIFHSLNSIEYTSLKYSMGDLILNDFCEKFHCDRHSISHLEIGTPRTFEYYTGRINGQVGGIGHHIGQKLKSRVLYHDLFENFYQLGDTIFPGQGIPAVIYGANSLVNSLHF